MIYDYFETNIKLGTKYYKLRIATEDYTEKELERIKKMVDSHGRTVSSNLNSSPNLNRGWPNLPSDFTINKKDFLSIHQKVPQRLTTLQKLRVVIHKTNIS